MQIMARGSMKRRSSDRILKVQRCRRAPSAERGVWLVPAMSVYVMQLVRQAFAAKQPDGAKGREG